MIFGIKEKWIILTHTMYCWLLLQIYLCYLWLLLCSRVTYWMNEYIYLHALKTNRIKMPVEHSSSTCVSFTHVYISSETVRSWIWILICYTFNLEAFLSLLPVLALPPGFSAITCPFGVADRGICAESDWIGDCGYSGASDSGRLGNFPLRQASHVTGLLNAA